MKIKKLCSSFFRRKKTTQNTWQKRHHFNAVFIPAERQNGKDIFRNRSNISESEDVSEISTYTGNNKNKFSEHFGIYERKLLTRFSLNKNFLINLSDPNDGHWNPEPNDHFCHKIEPNYYDQISFRTFIFHYYHKHQLIKLLTYS